MLARSAPIRALFVFLALALSLASIGAAQTASFDRESGAAGDRKVLGDVPSDLVPTYETLWKCACDSDGCWPGCFTLASASVLKYWSQKAYPNLWAYRGPEDENNGLIRLRELFPNLLCFGNGNGNGRPGDSGYDAYDVAAGLRQWIAERGYRFTVNPIASPTFEQIVAEIDAGRPIIGAFGQSPWGSHAGTILGYDTTQGKRILIVRPNLPDKSDTQLEWGVGYQDFGIVTVSPGGPPGKSAAPAQIQYDLIVNNGDPGFTAAGEWREVGGIGHAGASRYALTIDGALAGDETAFARWTPMIPFDGMWEIQAWMPLEKTDESTSGSTVYRVAHAEGQSLVRRSQRDSAQGWMSLGAYPLTRGERSSVAVGNASGEKGPRSVWADAVRFVWRSPLVVRAEDDTINTFLVRDGRRRLLPQDGGLAFGALRLLPNYIRKISPLQLAQYPTGEPIPSPLAAWVGQYFNNTQLAPPIAAIRNDSPLALRWDGLSPVAGVSAIGFSGRWTRMMAFSQGSYVFKIQAAGGLRFWVDGRLEIDQWDAQGSFIEHQARVALEGGLHRLEVEYVNRTGGAALIFADLPPNPPLPLDEPAIRFSRGVTATLRWLDTGDPDGNSADRPRKFNVSVGREVAGGEPSQLFSSGWTTETAWTAEFPGSGRYVWRVAATDGASVSEWSAARQIVVDRAPPWAQMVSATNPAEEQPSSAPGAARASVRPPGLRLQWMQTDTLSGVAFVDVQAREIVKPSIYTTITTEYHEVKRDAFAVVVENGREISQPTVITSLVAIPGLVAIREFRPDPGATWKLVKPNQTGTEAIFIGTPGSVYEFRARAVDFAGNAQDWYEGYSVTAQMDPNADLSTPTPTPSATPIPPTAKPATATAAASQTPTPTRTQAAPSSTSTPTVTPAPTRTQLPTPTETHTETPPVELTPIPTSTATPFAGPAVTPSATKSKATRTEPPPGRPDPADAADLDGRPLTRPTPTPTPTPKFVNSPYFRVEVLKSAFDEAPIPDAGTCDKFNGTEYGLRAIFALRVSNNSPIDIRGWQLTGLAGGAPVQVCMLGSAVSDRLPMVTAGARKDFIAVAYTEPGAPVTQLEARWQGERFRVCANGEISDGCAPLGEPANTGLKPPPPPLPDFRQAEEKGPQAAPAERTATPTAQPAPSPTPTRPPIRWTVAAQALDVSAWGRPMAGNCFAYDNDDPVLRWQFGLRIENQTEAELTGLRVTFFVGTVPILTCHHGYGKSLPVIPSSDGRNITFFGFTDNPQRVTSVLVEAMGQSRRLCVADKSLVACK